MQDKSADTLITAVSETLYLLSRDEYRMQLIRCHIGGKSAKFLEVLMLSRGHVELYCVVQCILNICI